MGLSQWEFSMRSGINIGTLRNWEQGRNHPQIEIVARLIAALGPYAQPLLERLGIEVSLIQDAGLSDDRRLKGLKPKREGSDTEKVRVK